MSGNPYNLEFGVMVFDNPKEPVAAWGASGRNELQRFNSVSEIGNSTIWLTNVEMGGPDAGFEHLAGVPWFRAANYLPAKWSIILREWGLSPRDGLPSDKVATAMSRIFNRVMYAAYDLVHSIEPDKTMRDVFRCPTLKEDLAIIMPVMDYPTGELARLMKPNVGYTYWTKTQVPVSPSEYKAEDNVIISARPPRMTLAQDILKTPVPGGTFTVASYERLRQKNPDVGAYVRNVLVPAFVEMRVSEFEPRMNRIYNFGGTMDKNTKHVRSWAAHPEFLTISRFSDADAEMVYFADRYEKVTQRMHPTVREFLQDRQNEFSWTAGIIAETLWRSVCLRDVHGRAGKYASGASISQQGAWLLAAERIKLFEYAMKLADADYRVMGYGSGRVDMLVDVGEVRDAVHDCLALGLVPSVSVSDKAYHIPLTQSFQWGGFDESLFLARLMVQESENLLSLFDQVIEQPPEEREQFLTDALERAKSFVRKKN